MADYGAGFRFSPDSQWLVRMQKMGGGWATLYWLPAPSGSNFTEATAKPLGEKAWDYYESVREALNLPSPNHHISADLVKGYEENYRWLGYDWPTGRYLIIPPLQRQQQNEVSHAYDTKSQKFFIPNDLETKRGASDPEKAGK